MATTHRADQIHHAIRDTILTATEPVTAGQIATDLDVHVHTVYRNLAQLERAGVVHRFTHGRNRVVWYPDGVPAPQRHSSRTCKTCRAIVTNRYKYRDPLGVTPPGNPRLPWGPLAAYLPKSDTRAAARLGVDQAQVVRWKQNGIALYDADRLATRLGVPTPLVWGDEYWSIPFRECEAA